MISKHDIIKAYGIEHPEVGADNPRGSFRSTKKGVVRHQVGVNDPPLGRNIDEMIRMADAPQFHEEHVVMFARTNGKKAKKVGASPDGVAKYLKANSGKL